MKNPKNYPRVFLLAMVTVFLLSMLIILGRELEITTERQVGNGQSRETVDILASSS